MHARVAVLVVALALTAPACAFGCRLPPRHPHPVVLVHGTFGNKTAYWRMARIVLRIHGYCAFALDYGGGGIGDIRRSAHELRRFVDRVLRRTHAAKVSIVGHSQGGMMPRWYIRFLGGRRRVDDLVGLAPTNHGTTTPLPSRDAAAKCPACAQQLAGSRFLRQLNAGDQTPGPVDYTVVQTRHDDVVRPFRSAFLPPSHDARVTNVLLQRKCPANRSDHLTVAHDGVALQWMLNALARRGPADPSYRPDCSGVRAWSFR